MGGEKILNIQLLGQPRIFWNQEQIILKRRTTRILLYFLAYPTDTKLVSRNELILMFWPDHAPEVARRNMRDLLSKLRKELPDEEILQTDREWVWLDDKKVRVDVLEFEENYRQLNLPILSSEIHPLPEMILQKMIHTVNMWQAPRFMDGDKTFEQEYIQEWVEDCKSRLSEKRLDLMMKLGRHFLLTTDYAQAIEWFDTVILEDEFYHFISAHVFRLEAIFRSGRISEAWEICKAIKADFSPDAFGKFTKLFNQLSQDITNARENTSVKVSERAHSLISDTIPYVGNEAALKTLNQFYQRGGVVFVEGEAGIGKTRLVSEGLKQFYPSPVILNLTAIASEKDISFHPVLTLFHRVMKAKDWDQIEPFWVNQLTGYFPELTASIEIEPLPGLIQSNNDPSHALFEAFFQVFSVLVDNKPFVIVLDDAQWCDLKTMQLFFLLIERKLFFEHGLLILISRLGPEHLGIEQIKNNTHWMDKIAVINLPYLNEAETTKITQYILRHPLPKAVINQLMLDTQGNPLFIIETIRAFLALNIDPKNAENWTQIPLPAVIQILIREQINLLSVPSKQVLHEAAVLGQNFDLLLLKLITTLSEDDLIIGLDELIQQGILEVETHLHQVNHYHFLKKRVRDVVLLEMGETKRQLIHSRIGKILMALPETNQSLVLSHQKAIHLTEAGEVFPAFDAWINFANLAEVDYQWKKVNEAYGMAKQITDIFPIPLTEAYYYKLYIGWGEAALSVFDFSTANQCFQRATMEGKRHGFYDLLVAGLRGQAYLYLQRDLPFHASGLLESAFELLPGRSAVEISKTKFIKGLLIYRQNQINSALLEFKSAMALSDISPDGKTPSEYFKAGFYAARILSLLGKLSEAENLAVELLHKARTQNQNKFFIQAEFTSGYVSLIKGKYSKALTYFGSCVDLALSINSWLMITDCWLMMIQLYIIKGQVYQAEDYIEKTEQLLKINPNSKLEFVLKLQQMMFAVYLGEWKAAVNLFNQMNQLEVDDSLRLIAQFSLSLAEFGLGEQDAAIYHMRDVLNIALLSDNHYMEYISRGQLILMQYIGNISYQKLEPEIKQFNQVIEECGFEGTGGLLQFINYQEFVKNKAWDKAQESIITLQELAEKREVAWYHCFAAELSEDLYIKSKGAAGMEKSNKRQVLQKIFIGMPDTLLLQKLESPYFPWVALR